MELSVTAPGLKRDMIAFTAKTIPKINAAVDHFTVSNQHDLREDSC